jgi:hypothetical protein
MDWFQQLICVCGDYRTGADLPSSGRGPYAVKTGEPERFSGFQAYVKRCFFAALFFPFVKLAGRDQCTSLFIS